MKCMNLLAWCFDQWQAKHVDQRPECFASDAKVVGEPTWRGNGILEAKQWMVTLVAILAMGTVTNANAGLFGLGGTSWREEVLLHDGGKVIVERSQNYGDGMRLGNRLRSRSTPSHSRSLIPVKRSSGKANMVKTSVVPISTFLRFMFSTVCHISSLSRISACPTTNGDDGSATFFL